jgi:hypothetical protein
MMIKESSGRCFWQKLPAKQNGFLLLNTKGPAEPETGSVFP